MMEHVMEQDRQLTAEVKNIGDYTTTAASENTTPWQQVENSAVHFTQGTQVPDARPRSH